jgi:hypothetical protein
MPVPVAATRPAISSSSVSGRFASAVRAQQDVDGRVERRVDDVALASGPDHEANGRTPQVHRPRCRCQPPVALGDRLVDEVLGVLFGDVGDAVDVEVAKPLDEPCDLGEHPPSRLVGAAEDHGELRADQRDFFIASVVWAGPESTTRLDQLSVTAMGVSSPGKPA